MNRLFNSKVLVMVFISLVYLLTLRGVYGNQNPLKVENLGSPPFETSMERGRFGQIYAISETGTIYVDAFPSFLEPDLAWYNGHFMSPFPVLTSLLSVPFYVVGKLLNINQVGTYLISVLATITTSYFLFLIFSTLGIKKRYAYIGVFAFTLGSVAFPYSVTLSAHSISALVTCVIFYTYLKIEKGTFKHAPFVLGLLYTLNLFLDYPNIIVLAPFILFALFKRFLDENADIKLELRQGSLRLIAPAILIFVIFVGYNLVVYKTPVAFSNTFSLKHLRVSGVEYTYDSLSNDLFKQVSYAKRFSFENVVKGSEVLLISKDRGLFFYSPIYLLLLPGLVFLFKENKRLFSLLLLVLLSNILIYASYDDPWGGWGFGPRYLIVSLPIMSFLISFAMDKFSEKHKAFITVPALILLSVSVWIALLGSLTSNAVPPSVEVEALGKASNFILNWEMINRGLISSFSYSFFFKDMLSPLKFYFLLAFMCTLVPILLVVKAHFEHE